MEMLYTLNSMSKLRIYMLVFFSILSTSQESIDFKNLEIYEESIDFKNLEIYERDLKDQLIDQYELPHDNWLSEKPLKTKKPEKDIWQKENEYLEILNIWEKEYLEILKIWKDNPPSRISKITKQKLDIKLACDNDDDFHFEKNDKFVCYDVESESLIVDTRIIPISRDFMRENFENISFFIITESSAYSSREQISYSRAPINYLILNNEELVKLGDLRNRFITKFYNNADPQYPKRALDRGVMGLAIVEFTINDTGSVENAEVVELQGYCYYNDPRDPDAESFPCTMFNSASIRAALLLKYNPLIYDGQAVPVYGKRHGFIYLIED